MIENPVCPNCKTIYDRVAVTRELRKLTPEMFDFAAWSTRFKCVKCATEIEISGSSSEGS